MLKPKDGVKMKIARLLISGALVLGMGNTIFAAEQKESLTLEDMPLEIQVQIIKESIGIQPDFSTAVKALDSLNRTSKELNLVIRNFVIPDLAKSFLKKTEAQDKLFELVKNRKLNPFVLEVLLKAGADLNQHDIWADTVLTLAAKHGYAAIVNMLIEKGASLNIQNINGETALMWAALWGHTEIAEMLIKTGADINMQNNRDETALDLAERYRQKEIVTMLEKAIKKQNPNKN